MIGNLFFLLSLFICYMLHYKMILFRFLGLFNRAKKERKGLFNISDYDINTYSCKNITPNNVSARTLYR